MSILMGFGVEWSWFSVIDILTMSLEKNKKKGKAPPMTIGCVVKNHGGI